MNKPMTYLFTVSSPSLASVCFLFFFFFFSYAPLLECCRVDDTSPQRTVVGLRRGSSVSK